MTDIALLTIPCTDKDDIRCIIDECNKNNYDINDFRFHHIDTTDTSSNLHNITGKMQVTYSKANKVNVYTTGDVAAWVAEFINDIQSHKF
jgi:hypothetical protein